MGFEGLWFDPDQGEPLGRLPRHVQCREHIRQPQLMGGDLATKQGRDLLILQGHHGAGRIAASHRIRQYDVIAARHGLQQLHAGGAAVEQLDAGGEAVFAPQRLDDAHTHRLVAQEQVAHSQDQGIHHSTFTRVTSPFWASTTWTAQDMQGSKEWMVRTTSRGLAGSATGVPTRDCS